jgi:hypothetical protein
MAEWLAGQFTVLGVHFQNWMVIALIIVAAASVHAWRKKDY